ncbi:MAG: sulfurtransferase [Oligoflexia bacterium]|nr:sulfurtransferase [Oligoflexia bacterium]
MFTHISFYKFVEINNTEELKASLKDMCIKFNLKGTILLASEGINGMLAGEKTNIDLFISELQKDQRFESGILYKFNTTENAPFKRMLVKIKKEILTFKEPQIKPHIKTGKYVKPTQLRDWLRKGENLVLLDTRNDYEVECGTFKDAINPNIKYFTHFKDYINAHAGELKDKKVVAFCTGGIRCEKATAYMMEKGIDDVYQIEGGILKYLEETGGEFWQGDCFVFDHRRAIDCELHEVPAERKV